MNKDEAVVEEETEEDLVEEDLDESDGDYEEEVVSLNGDNSNCSEGKPKVESKENFETESSKPVTASSSGTASTSITTTTTTTTTSVNSTEQPAMSASGRTREHHSSPKQGALCPDPSQLFAAAAAAFPFNPFGTAGANPNAWMDIQRAISAAANAQSKLFQSQVPTESRSSPSNCHSPLPQNSSRAESQPEPKSKSAHHDLPLDLSSATTTSATPTTNSVKMSSGHKSSKENTLTTSSLTTPTSAMLAASAVANAARKVNNFSNADSPAFPPLADHLKSLGAVANSLQPGSFNGFDPSALAAAYGFDPTAFFGGASRHSANAYASLGKVNGASAAGGANGFMSSFLDQQALLASLGAAKTPHFSPSRPALPSTGGNSFMESFYARMQQFLEQSQQSQKSPSVNQHHQSPHHQSSPKLSSPKSGHNSAFNSSAQLPPYSSGAAFPTPSRGSAFTPATPSAVFPSSGHHNHPHHHHQQQQQQQQQPPAAPPQSAFADYMRMSSRNGRPAEVSLSPAAAAVAAAAAADRMRHSTSGSGRPAAHHLTNGGRSAHPHGKERRTDSRYKCGYCYKVIRKPEIAQCSPINFFLF